MPESVIDAISRYMRTTYVQLGAPYNLSAEATSIVEEAHRWVEVVLGAEQDGMAVLGSSSTQLAGMLARCMAERLKPGDEIVINETGHEANIGPWVALEDRGVRIRWWKPINKAGETPIEALEGLVGPRTRLVCMPHVSNLLGAVNDVREAAKVAHSVGAEIVVDGVAYAPHRPMHVNEWDVDWYFYSTYKVYGPHMAALYGRKSSFDQLRGPNHFFLSNQDAYKFEPGGPCHEGCAGILGLKPYVAMLSGGNHEPDRRDIVTAFSRMGQAELILQERMIDALLSLGCEILGPATSGVERVPTVSFVHRALPSDAIARAMCGKGFGIRAGHMYAYRLCERLGYSTAVGVARVSLLHYNTVEEVDGFSTALSEVVS